MFLARLLLFVCLAAVASAQPSVALFGQIDDIMNTLSEITGWKVKHKVPATMLKQGNFRKLMQAHEKDGNNKEAHAEELILKMFGFVPNDFNLVSESVDLISEQAAAFYDYKKKRLVVLDSTEEGPDQILALAHELAHALADQQHPLGKFSRKAGDDDDAATAIQAVMEGQATWLSLAYISKKSGGPPEVPPRLLKEAETLAGADGSDYPVFTKAPLYIRESLVFPYNSGVKFEDAVFRKLGKAGFDEVFDHPPASTHQIMHPEAYFAGTKSQNPVGSDLAAALGKDSRRFHTVTDGDLGEFDVNILLRQYAGDATAAAAAHFQGGTYRLFEEKDGKHPILVHSAIWDSADAAREYFRLYQTVLRGKWKKLEITSSTPEKVSGTGDSGKFELLLSGTLVQSLEGLP